MKRWFVLVAGIVLWGCSGSGSLRPDDPPGDDDVGPADDDTADGDDDVTGDDDVEEPEHVPGAEYVPFDVPPVLLVHVGGDIPADVKIDGLLELIEDHDGSLLDLADAPRSWEGRIGIEIRGQTSSGFPKKSYNFEARDADGDDIDVTLLGMPDESDWVLYGPYSDKTFLRNILVYRLGSELGRWQPRTRIVELFIDEEYQGVYVVIEKIKRDAGRVDIARPAATAAEGDLTGGYIFKREGAGQNEGWTSAHQIVWDHHYPRHEDITGEQDAYLQSYVDAFESTMLGPDFANPQLGYRAWIDVPSWVDFAIMQEISRNIDGYKKSSYYHKAADPDGGLLHMGPLWDFNIAFANVNYCDGWLTDGLVVYTNWCFAWPDEYTPWWERLMEDPAFTTDLRCRWEELRGDVLSMAHIDALIDEELAQLVEAEPRDHVLWPVIGEYLWPNYFVGESYTEEVDFLRGWIDARLLWLDGNLPGVCP